MAAPYVAELQTARWTSDALHGELRNLGFRVREWPVTQHLERDLPADSVFFDPQNSKLLGIQYKTLYHNGEDHWPLDGEQHKTLRAFPWIYYCCSEIRDPHESGIALHYARFYRVTFDYQLYLPRRMYSFDGKFFSRWGALYRALRQCKAGIKITSKEQLLNLLLGVKGQARKREVLQLVEYLLADLQNQVVYSYREFARKQ